MGDEFGGVAGRHHRLAAAGALQSRREFLGVVRDLDQPPCGEGFGDLRLVVVVDLSEASQSRNGDDPAAFTKCGDERAGAAVADHQVGMAEQLLHLIEGSVSKHSKSCDAAAAYPGLKHDALENPALSMDVGDHVDQPVELQECRPPTVAKSSGSLTGRGAESIRSGLNSAASGQNECNAAD